MIIPLLLVLNHPELGGAGQWMRGGLLMIEDAFNHELKARVDALCHALGECVDKPGTSPTAFARQRQSQTQSSADGDDNVFEYAGSPSSGAWWPEALGQPNATGQQNDLHYAYFAAPQRLAIRMGDRISIHDTGDHRITGVSQQQGNSLLSLPLLSSKGFYIYISASSVICIRVPNLRFRHFSGVFIDLILSPI